VSERTGCAFVVIHHAGKPKEAHADARTVPRGSSAIFDAAGCVLVVTGEKGGPKLVRQEKTPAEAEGSAIEPFYLVIEDVAVNGSPTGGVKVVHRTREQISPPRAPGADFKEAIAKVKDCITKNPGIAGKDAVREMVGLRSTTVRAAVDTLIANGEVVNRARKGVRLFVNAVNAEENFE
jgi:hypothetical protein